MNAMNRRSIRAGQKAHGSSTTTATLRSPKRRCNVRTNVATSIEPLESRTLMAANFASVDGSGHNLLHPDWGKAGTDFLRKSPAAYADGISKPAGQNRPSARAVSNAVAAQSADTPTNDRYMSAFVYAWGQFIDHDLDLTNAADPAESFDIKVPTGDAYFDPSGTWTQVIPLSRSKYDPATGKSIGNPRQQVNDITSWLDASMVYGSDVTTAASLRTFVGGKMKTSAGNLLPIDPASGLPMAGDIRAAENPDLQSLQVLFVREHNNIATQVAKQNPNFGDEQIYQMARQRVAQEIQAITFNEFLPALLGPAAPGAYRGYNANVNPGIATEFSTAAYRIGHTLVGDDIEFLDNNGDEVHDPLSLAQAFFDTTTLPQTGIDPILKYLASDNAEEVDTHVIDDLRNFLFGAPGSGGMDLASLNIQRGRDHGLADYNTVRAAYGLPRVTSFAQITPDVSLQHQLQSVYGGVNNIDLWVGGLAENHLPGSSVGPTFARIIGDQFSRLRDGDRLWYQDVTSGADRDRLDHLHLADIIRRNTNVTNLQDNVFVFRATIGGQLFADVNANGRRDLGEPGIGGRDVRLIADDGTVVDHVLTRPDGGYRFDGLDLGSYRVEVTPAPGAWLTTPPRSIDLTRGMLVDNVFVGESRPNVAQPPPPRPGQQPPPPPSRMTPIRTANGDIRLADGVLGIGGNVRLLQ
jgi:hypothetical protein